MLRGRSSPDWRSASHAERRRQAFSPAPRPAARKNGTGAAFYAAPISANFALFHMKHRLSLCFRHARFCRVFARSSSRFGAISGENSDFSLFSSLATDLRLFPRAAAVTQSATCRGSARPATDRRTNPEDKQKAHGAREGMGEQPERDRPA